MRFRWPDWLVLCGHKADLCKKSMRFQKNPESYRRILNKVYTFHDGLTDAILGYFPRGRSKIQATKSKNWYGWIFFDEFCPSSSFSLLLLLNFLLSSSAYNLIRSFPNTSCRTKKEGERSRCSEGPSFFRFLRCLCVEFPWLRAPLGGKSVTTMRYLSVNRISSLVNNTYVRRYDSRVKKNLHRKSFRIKANTQLPITAEAAPVYVNENTILGLSYS